MMLPKVEFYGKKFEKLCKELRWTKTAIAQQCGLTRQSIDMWIKGKIIPNEGKIRLLARKLGVKISDISNIADNIPVSDKDITPIADVWKAFVNSSDETRFSKVDSFVKQIYTHYKEQEQIFLLMKTLLDSMHSIFYVKDKSLKYILANRAFLNNLELKSDFNVHGKKDEEFFVKHEAKENHEEDKKVFSTGEQIVNLERDIFGSKNMRKGLISKYPIMDNKNQVMGVIGSIVDITDLGNNC